MSAKENTMLPTNHTFVICAYGENAYLEECVKSVVEQSEPSNILISTSTDFSHIASIAQRYNIPVYVNYGAGTMQDNWNFGMQCAKTDFVTICHQDDTYDKDYFRAIRPYLQEDVIFLHTGYWNVKDQVSFSNINNRVRRILNAPLRIRVLQRSRFVKRNVLRFGNPVCCPSCTYNVAQTRRPLFQSKLTHGLDWDTYIDLADLKGRVVYINERVCNKRTHCESATTSDIQSGVRAREDEYLFSRLWPRWVAKSLLALYKRIYKYSL